MADTSEPTFLEKAKAAGCGALDYFTFGTAKWILGNDYAQASQRLHDRATGAYKVGAWTGGILAAGAIAGTILGGLSVGGAVAGSTVAGGLGARIGVGVLKIMARPLAATARGTGSLLWGAGKWAFKKALWIGGLGFLGFTAWEHWGKDKPLDQAANAAVGDVSDTAGKAYQIAQDIVPPVVNGAGAAAGNVISGAVSGTKDLVSGNGASAPNGTGGISSDAPEGTKTLLLLGDGGLNDHDNAGKKAFGDIATKLGTVDQGKLKAFNANLAAVPADKRIAIFEDTITKLRSVQDGDIPTDETARNKKLADIYNSTGFGQLLQGPQKDGAAQLPLDVGFANAMLETYRVGKAAMLNANLTPAPADLAPPPVQPATTAPTPGASTSTAPRVVLPQTSSIINPNDPVRAWGEAANSSDKAFNEDRQNAYSFNFQDATVIIARKTDNGPASYSAQIVSHGKVQHVTIGDEVAYNGLMDKLRTQGPNGFMASLQGGAQGQNLQQNYVQAASPANPPPNFYAGSPYAPINPNYPGYNGAPPQWPVYISANPGERLGAEAVLAVQNTILLPFRILGFGADVMRGAADQVARINPPPPNSWRPVANNDNSSAPAGPVPQAASAPNYGSLNCLNSLGTEYCGVPSAPDRRSLSTTTADATPPQPSQVSPNFIPPGGWKSGNTPAAYGMGTHDVG